MPAVVLTVANARSDLERALAALFDLDVAYLRRHQAPMLYRAGVRYRREAPGREVWQTVPYVLASGHGDCEDLAAWRAAELVASGVDAAARPVLREVHHGYWHAVVRRGNGRVEDPSRVLGMR